MCVFLGNLDTAVNLLQKIESIPPKLSPIPKIVVLFVMMSLFPFLMRMEIDFSAVKKQAVSNIYQQWKLDHPHLLQKHTSASFSYNEAETDNAIELAYFRELLQNDILVTDTNTTLGIKVNMHSTHYLSTRIQMVENAINNKEWNGRTRYTNNGILLGPWLGSFLFLLGLPIAKCAVLAGFFMLLWQGTWNPTQLFLTLKDLFRATARDLELASIAQIKDVSPQTLLLISCALFLLLSFGISNILKQRYKKVKLSQRLYFYGILAFFALEPLMLWVFSIFSKWHTDSLWWKVYLGSIPYRFISFGFIILLLHNKNNRQHLFHEKIYNIKFSNMALILPLCFILAGGWPWINATMIAEPLDILMRLKTFWIGILIAILMGNRFASMMIGMLAYAYITPPSKGHYLAAAQFACLMDGLFLGWWLSPFKNHQPLMPLPITGTRLIFLTIIGWGFGVFLSSLGLSYWLSWPLFLLFFLLFHQSQNNKIYHVISDI